MKALSDIIGSAKQVVVKAICDPGTNDPFVVSSETGNVFVVASPEEFTYDDDGNLLSDGRFEYQWDCENRLIAATTKDGLPEDMPIVHVEFEYDYMSRRVGKTVYEYDTGITNWVQTDSWSFLYDSWNVIQEVSIQDSEVSTNQYVWGLDLSGSLQGAGGIGGLLASYSSGGTSATSSVFTFDGNGNVSELISTNGTIAAHYEHSPFGETIVATGPLAVENPFRFSTKYFDDETGLAYYGYRYYSPPTGKWISDDPLLDPGSPAVMAIKEQVLAALEIYARMCATVMLNEELSDEMRILALLELVSTGKSADALMCNEPAFWLSMTGDNWTMFCGNNSVNYIDPLGLWGVQFGSVNLGYGYPWLIFDKSSWMEISKGAAAALDGIIPFADPFEMAYTDECGNVDSAYRISRHLGAFSRDIYLGARIPNIGKWLKNPVWYERGSATVPTRVFNMIEGLSPTWRGRWLATFGETFGPYGAGEMAAAYGATWNTGFTPGGRLLLELIPFSVTDTLVRSSK